MKSSFLSLFHLVGGLWLVLAQTDNASGLGQADAPAPAAVIVEFRGGGVEVSRQPDVWDPARTNQALYPGNLIRTDQHSQALVRFSDLETIRLAERSSLRIGDTGREKRGFDFLKGLLYFFHRDKPNQFEVHTPQMSAIIRGTEFTLEVDQDGTSTLSLLEGEVALGNQLGQIELKTGEQGIVAPGAAPSKTAILNAANVIQWCLYYPAVLDPEELRLSAEERGLLSKSLTAYQQGDLVAALAAYPNEREPGSDAERLYLAALRLSFGQVRPAEDLLEAVTNGLPSELAVALRTLIATVKGQDSPSILNSQFSTRWLAESYRLQSLGNLPGARRAAQKAAELSPNFSFAWARLAELEFGFGRTRAASEAIQKSLQLAPRNAQAHALSGFLLAAANRLNDALAAFDEAISMDSALANGWLGRGLCRIRRGQAEAGRLDLQIAAMVEPNRAVLRSYLAKAFSNAGQDTRAVRELDLAKKLDPHDPTAWLYSSLLGFQQHRVNEAVRDLEESQQLNDDRQVYRSKLLLEQDQAVRSASLAAIYQQAGMADVSLREAARAVANDYGNYSAHLFLANSFDALRDPTRFNLRYETAWFNELLLANVLSPVGAGALSQNISQQEYSKLFETDRLGLITDTTGRSDGQVRESVSQFGTIHNFSYSLDLDYQHNDGVRPNNELNRIEWYSQAKFQLTPADTLFLLTKYQDYHSGDNFQYYDWHGNISTHFTFDELQTPIVIAGYHHEWSPGVHTLLLAGRLENAQHISDKAVPELRISKLDGKTIFVSPYAFDLDYRSEFESGTAELNQIFQSDRQVLSVGARFQAGHFQTQDILVDPLGLVCPINATNFTLTNCYLMPAASTASKDDFQRASAYAYYTLEPWTDLFVTAGLSYDSVKYPANFRNPPIFSGEETKDLVGPKAALVYSPADWLTLRGVYTRSLGGVSLDESFRLEPTQLAGFIQSFRSVIPESVVGSVSAPEFETYGAALDFKFKTGTYVGIQAERLSSDLNREIGVFDFVNAAPPILPSSTRQRLEFEERSIGIGLNQLLGERWSAGISYKFTSSELRRDLLDIPLSVFASADDTTRSDLHQLGAYLLFNHYSGFFARAEVNWYAQDNTLRTHDVNLAEVHTDLPGDQFQQVNLYVGWRFQRQHGDLSFGVLNVGGGDYHLDPLNSYPELPHERVYAARLRLRF